MGNVGQVASWKFVGREEGPIQEEVVASLGEGFEGGFQAVPGVDVGSMEQAAALGSADEEGEGAAELVPMGNLQRHHLEAFLQGNHGAGLKGVQFDLAQFHELAPGTVFPEELRHPRPAPDGHGFRGRGFAAQPGQAQVVADVGMGEENPPRHLAHAGDLGGEVGGSVHEPPTGAPADAQRGHGFPLAALAAGLPATRVGPTAVLGDA